MLPISSCVLGDDRLLQFSNVDPCSRSGPLHTRFTENGASPGQELVVSPLSGGRLVLQPYQPVVLELRTQEKPPRAAIDVGPWQRSEAHKRRLRELLE
jgi:hypothetical protein